MQKPYDPLPFRRLVFGTLRRLLYLWVRSETINQSSFTLNLDRSRPVFYVLQDPSLTDLAVLDTECTKAGLPRPVLPVSVGNLWSRRRFLPDASAGLARPPGQARCAADPDATGRRPDPRCRRRRPDHSGQRVLGQSPDSESSPWKLLFADSWAVTGRLRRLLSIMILGRKTRVQFSAPIHLRELIEHDKGHERTVRMAQRILRVHFRNLKAAVIGPDISHRRNLVKGLLNQPLVKQAIADEAEREKSPRKKPRPRPCATATRLPRTTPTPRSVSWKWC